jgi:hypothetical protein
MGPTTTPAIQALLFEADFGIDVDSVSCGMVEVEVAILVGVDAAKQVSAEEIELSSWERTTTRLHRSRADCLSKTIDLKSWGWDFARTTLSIEGREAEHPEIIVIESAGGYQYIPFIRYCSCNVDAA